MKTYFMLGDRQCGKTTHGIYEAMKDPENTLILVNKSQYAKHVKLYVKREFDMDLNIESVTEDSLRGRLYKKVILDEFFFMKNFKDVYYAAVSIIRPDGELYIFSSYNNLIEDFKFANNPKNGAKVVNLTKNYIPVKINSLKDSYGNNLLMGKDLILPQQVIDDLIKDYGQLKDNNISFDKEVAENLNKMIDEYIDSKVQNNFITTSTEDGFKDLRDSMKGL